MRLITIFELAVRSESELRAMFRKASEELVQGDHTPEERANTRKSLDNISSAMRCRNAPKP